MTKMIPHGAFMVDRQLILTFKIKDVDVLRLYHYLSFIKTNVDLQFTQTLSCAMSFHILDALSRIRTSYKTSIYNSCMRCHFKPYHNNKPFINLAITLLNSHKVLRKIF